MKFVFLIAWMSGSESEEEYGPLSTNCHSQDDLWNQFKAGNEAIFAVEIFAPSESIAEAIGYQKAFFENYTAHDSISTCMQISMDEKLPVKIPSFIITNDNKIEELFST